MARGKQLWRELHAVYSFTEAPEKQAILEEACRTADVVKRLQAIVDAADDLRVKGSQQQPVAMPELLELRQYREVEPPWVGPSATAARHLYRLQRIWQPVSPSTSATRTASATESPWTNTNEPSLTTSAPREYP